MRTPMMGIFFDTFRIDEISKHHALSITCSVTMNAAILAKERIASSSVDTGKQCKKIDQSHIVEQDVPPLNVEFSVVRRLAKRPLSNGRRSDYEH